MELLLIAITLINVALVATGTTILLRVFLTFNAQIKALSDFTSANGENPSNLALLWDSMVDRASSKVSMGMLGVKSGESRRESAAEVDYIKSVVAADQPVIAMALNQFFPKWGKMLQKNPEMLPKMMEFMETKMGGSPQGPPSNGAQTHMKFPL